MLWCVRRRSISASTGATSIWSSTSARRRARSRLLQRIGRANHRMDEPSRGVLVPANRFEVLECAAAVDAVTENAQDTPPLRTGGARRAGAAHSRLRLRRAFLSDELYEEMTAGGALFRARAHGFRRCGRFRRHRRLCAESL